MATGTIASAFQATVAMLFAVMACMVCLGPSMVVTAYVLGVYTVVMANIVCSWRAASLAPSESPAVLQVMVTLLALFLRSRSFASEVLLAR